jgi:hypothetical protein
MQAHYERNSSGRNLIDQTSRQAHQMLDMNEMRAFLLQDGGQSGGQSALSECVEED